MKKLVLSLLLLSGMSFFGATTNAQSYGIGTNVLNLGVGFGYSLGYVTNTTETPVLSASFEHGFKELGPGILGIGGVFSYQGARWEYSDGYGDVYKQTWKTMFIGARATWHPDILVGDKYDVYGGAQLGYYHFGYTYTATGPNANAFNYSNPRSSRVGLGFFVGGRYYFTDNIGAFGEVGYDISYLKLGLSVKFGGGAAK